jgi:hypothetical protein
MNPEFEPAGPWAYRRRRPGVADLQYDPPSLAPQTRTVNTGSLPFWEKNDDPGV